MTPYLSLESLETRETPAIVFVGGWGSSMYQSSSGAEAPHWKVEFSLHRGQDSADQSQAVTGRITAVVVDPSDISEPERIGPFYAFQAQRL